MALIAAAIGATALISSATTYFFSRGSEQDSTETIKGQINLINQAHSDKNENQDSLIFIAIGMCALLMIVIALKMFAKHITKKTERRINEHDMAQV